MGRPPLPAGKNPLRQLRLARGLTLEQLSELSGIAVASLSYIERGIREPTTTTLAKIARAFGIDDLSRLLEPWLAA